MRLSTAQAELIKEHVRNIFGQDVEVWLFGSRVYDELKGGDIDLLVSAPAAICERVANTCRLHAALQLALGEQKIDIVTLDPTMTAQPIHESAKLSGVRL